MAVIILLPYVLWNAVINAAEKNNSPFTCSAVDVMFLWVNGSDPRFVESYERHTGLKVDMTRFRDYGTLRFGVRSVFKNVPFMRQLVLVTNGQVPSWLADDAISSGRVRLLTHEDIFVDKDALPVFNSNAIEANIPFIPGLADCVIYLNDDIMVMKELSIEKHFVDQRTGKLKVHLDCDKAPNSGSKADIWRRLMAYSNTLLNDHYYPDRTGEISHHYNGHYCAMLTRPVLDKMKDHFHDELLETSRRKLRSGNDTSLLFFNANIPLEEGMGVPVFHELGGTGKLWTSNHARNERLWRRIASNPPYCLCLQDGFDGSDDTEREVASLTEKLCSVFPEPCAIEKGNDNPC